MAVKQLLHRVPVALTRALEQREGRFGAAAGCVVRVRLGDTPGRSFMTVECQGRLILTPPGPANVLTRRLSESRR